MKEIDHVQDGVKILKSVLKKYDRGELRPIYTQNAVPMPCR